MKNSIAWGILLVAVCGLSFTEAMPVEPHTPAELAEMDKIANFGEMKSYIYAKMKAVRAKVMGGKGMKAEEAAAIGKTIVAMKEKAAIAAERVILTKTDCVVSDFSVFSSCSKKCDGGESIKTRTVTQPANAGGKACPPLEEKIACNVQSCDVMEAKHDEAVLILTKEQHAIEKAKLDKKIEAGEEATTVADMIKASREVMHLSMRDAMSVLHIPGQEEQEELTDEQKVAPLLKAAMAKNAVDDAMQEFEKLKHNDQQDEHDEHDATHTEAAKILHVDNHLKPVISIPDGQ